MQPMKDALPIMAHNLQWVGPVAIEVLELDIQRVELLILALFAEDVHLTI